ncbi:MFS transporter [Phycicoccus endophyticus]|uniref:MFS transporter n=1 Tax=Phycicoccus endophyticus TaxID=1690220 RepID=A0A7G9R078_9MICO|nr:MFS transporter [Phycicoccus endophyticus]NHI20200.1 MFS transporter [Phycicoccus endophyticus]QNN49003.1 MFS transporter [Phycicoccus endophyticus]GGL44489.1 MFS transporter [Phycicoccus endophyticus]
MDPSVALVRTHRSFRWYWLGQSISSAGSQVTVLALPLVTALALDGSPADVGAVATAAMLPYLLFSLVAGHLLEGRQGRQTMVPADLAQAVLLALVPLAAATGWLTVPLLAVIAFLAGTAALVFGVSAFAYVPSLVERRDLAAANRAVQGSRTVTEVAGPGLAGLLVGALGPAAAMAVDALSYLASALGVAMGRPARPPARAEDPGEGAGEERVRVTTGLRILFRDRHLRALTVHAAAYNLAEEVFLINLVLWAVQDQDVPASAYGLALAMAGVGGLVGTLSALRLADRLGFGRAFAASLVLSCGVPVLVAGWPLHGVALAVALGLVMLVSGAGLGNANVYSLTLRQTLIPPTQLSRSAGAYTQVMYGSIPLGSALGGLVGETLGTRVGVLLGGVGIALSAAPMLTRSVRSLRLDLSATAPAEAAAD